MPDLSYTEVHVQVPSDSTETVVLALENYGTGDLAFHISEVPYDAPFPTPAGVLQTTSGQMPSSEMPVGIAPEVYADLEASPDGTAPPVALLDKSPIFAATQTLTPIHTRSPTPLPPEEVEASPRGSARGVKP
jgi:hypothetical protein